MKRTSLSVLTVLSSAILLASCVATEPAASNDSKQDESSSVLPLSGTTSLPSEASQLIFANNEESVMPTYDAASKTYIFEVGVEKRSYTITGSFDGRFLVKDTELTEYKGITFKLNNATLRNNATDGSVFVYMPSSKAITIEALNNTKNTITAKGTAIDSKNNVNLCGTGELSIKSVDYHAVKGDDVRCYDTVTINIEGSGKDGLHGKRFYTDDGGDGAEKKNYNGTINMKAITKQAFDFIDDKDWSGFIEINTLTKINVDSCENVFKSDARIVLDGEITATRVVDKAITKDKLNTNNLLVLVSGNVSFNGKAFEKGTYNY